MKMAEKANKKVADKVTKRYAEYLANRRKIYEDIPDATNFEGISKKDPTKSILHTMGRKWAECPLCKGFGGWNYSKNLDRGTYNVGFCSQCNGYGYVEKGTTDETCIHTVRELDQSECRVKGVKHWGSCYHVTECVKCGNIRAYDSSD